MQFSEEVKVERGHAVVIRDAREEVHQNKLTVALSSVSRFLFSCSFLFRAALDNNNSRRASSRNSYKNISYQQTTLQKKISDEDAL